MLLCLAWCARLHAERDIRVHSCGRVQLSQIEEGNYFLEDNQHSVQLNLENAVVHAGVVTETSIVMARVRVRQVASVGTPQLTQECRVSITRVCW
jgi:ADP-glucose pyrophosphorylase